MSGPQHVELELLGRRIGRLRASHSWTQQDLADRLAMSRTAVSHLEASISQPSERTVILLAGLFRLEPLDLVEGTTYPLSKAERLPAIVPRYTEIDLQIAMLRNEQSIWVHLPEAALEQRRSYWNEMLSAIMDLSIDAPSRSVLKEILRELRSYASVPAR
jgi:transcriptional regulator with XRE-family HTH domain